MASNKKKERHMDLDEFDPNQFDISFSSSSDVSIAPSTRTKDEHREDKKLIDQLSGITALMKRIDNQLANKDRLLNSAANTPMKMNNLPLQFSQSKSPKKFATPDDAIEPGRGDRPKNVSPFEENPYPNDRDRPKNRTDGSRDPKDRSRHDRDDPRNKDDSADPRRSRDNSRDPKNRRDRSDDEDLPRRPKQGDPEEVRRRRRPRHPLQRRPPRKTQAGLPRSSRRRLQAT